MILKHRSFPQCALAAKKLKCDLISLVKQESRAIKTELLWCGDQSTISQVTIVFLINSFLWPLTYLFKEVKLTNPQPESPCYISCTIFELFTARLLLSYFDLSVVVVVAAAVVANNVKIHGFVICQKKTFFTWDIEVLPAIGHTDSWHASRLLMTPLFISPQVMQRLAPPQKIHEPLQFL